MRGLEIEEVLRQALDRHGPRGLVLLCSFQKEESVLLDALLTLEPQARVATIDTGVLFPETLATWKEFEDRWGVEIEVADATGPWSTDLCCGDAKVRALGEALMGSDGWITGLRREQSATRATAQQVEFDDARGMWKYNPLALWTEEDVWKRVLDRDLPYNQLHDEGYASIGCAPCTQPGTGREGRWAGSDKTECGLHVIT
jgi:phosphoadenosine phosphosulfate reductase